MTLDEIRTRLHSIWALGLEGGDFEAAHEAEDELHRAVLSAIAEGELSNGDARMAASMAMRSTKIPFKRECA